MDLDAMYHRIYEIPFDSTRKLMTTVHRSPDTAPIAVLLRVPMIFNRGCIYIYRTESKNP